MPRKKEPYRVGEYWLAKRRDGKSPNIWQITRYSDKSRSNVYRSTRTGDEQLARAALHAFVEDQRAKKPQEVEAAVVLPQIKLYWNEHAKDTSKPGTIGTSLRAFIGFMAQDEIGETATIADLKPQVFVRFRQWRMKPHRYTVPWAGKPMSVESQGVSGETVQRNLDDVRAMLNHSAKAARIPYAPKVPSVPTELRSPARDVRVTLAELGAMVGFWSSPIETSQPDPIPADKATVWWLQLMIATACRPEVAMKFDPREQWKGPIIVLHPKGAKRTKKRNPNVPTIPPFEAALEQWRGSNEPVVKSRRTAWRTMREALGLPKVVIPKTVRHTIATELRSMGVPAEQISGLLGHQAMSRITEVYAKYDPAYLREAKAALTTIYERVAEHAEKWRADHRRTKVGNGRVIVVAREREKE